MMDFNQNKNNNENQIHEQEILKKAAPEDTIKRMRPRYPRFLIPVVIVAAVFILGAVGFFISPWGTPVWNGIVAAFAPNGADPTDNESLSGGADEDFKATLLADTDPVNGVMLTPGVDFVVDANLEQTMKNTVSSIAADGFNTIYLKLNYNNGYITSVGGATNTAPVDGLKLIAAAAAEAELKLYGVVDLSGRNIVSSEEQKSITEFIKQVAQVEGVRGVMLSGAGVQRGVISYKDYLNSGNFGGFSAYCGEVLKDSLENISMGYKAGTDNGYIGLISPGAYSESDKKITANGGFDLVNAVNEELFDVVMVENLGSIESTALPFEQMAAQYNEGTKSSATRLGFTIYSTKIGGEYKNPDQLTRQLQIVSELQRGVFYFDSYKSLKDDTTGAAAAALKYMQGKMNEYQPKGLTFNSPKSLSVTTTESSIAISGASDPEFPLTMDGKDVERTTDGFFSFQQSLKIGSNKFVFSHKGSSTTLNINYKYVILNGNSPSSSLTLDGGTTVVLKATARAGAKVTAEFNGVTIALNKSTVGNDKVDVSDDDFTTFTGSVTLPAASGTAQNLGKIKFTATYEGASESDYSGDIIVKKSPDPESSGGTGDGGVLPGNRLIAEVVKFQIETFDGDKLDDASRPTNAYLPKGTVDYASENTIYASGMYYRKLGYGKRVYVSNSNGTNIKTYRGSLPENNQLSVKSFTSSGRYTVMTLDTAWHAPHNVDVKPQSYTNPATQDYTLSQVTYNYVEITFPYASSFTGDINLEGNPLFSKSELIKNDGSYTLRLYLKKTGAFYGYTAEFTSEGDLQFKFLNPVNVSGRNLSGVRIVVDAGHGGSDSGATARDNRGNLIKESETALVLAKKVQQKLQALGATVIMTRTSDVTLSQDERVLAIRNANADFAISIHRNSSSSATPSAFKSYHFNAFTKNPAQYIYNATEAKNLYTKTKWSGVGWHYFYLSRISSMPVVLTENGFMSNAAELQKIISDEFNDKCADAIVDGIVNYFNSQ